MVVGERNADKSQQGVSGLDGTDLLPQPLARPVVRPNAVLAMRHALIEQPEGTAWLVATGTLTNVSLLFATFPELAEHIKGLSIMGGAIGGGFTDAPLGYVKGEGERFGNWTRWAEFNIYVRAIRGPRICIRQIGSDAQAVRSRSCEIDLLEPNACSEDDPDTARSHS